MEQGHVTFTYRRRGETRERTMRLLVFEFLRRFLQHVLPRGLQKIRHCGFLSRHAKTSLEAVRAAILDSLRDIEPDLELEAWTVAALTLPTDAGPTCPVCGGRLEFESFHRIRPPPLADRKESQHATTNSI